VIGREHKTDHNSPHFTRHSRIEPGGVSGW
jgi:hypothetical protein